MGSEIQDFTDFLNANGFRPRGEVLADDKWGWAFFGDEKKPTGRYSLKIDEQGAVGIVFTFKNPDKKHVWNSRRAESLSPEERKKIADRIRAQKKAAQKKQSEKEARFARRLKKLWAKLPAAENHPYLDRKKIGAHNAKIRKNGELLIPLFDSAGSLTTLERISAKGDKWMLSSEFGARMKGSYSPLAKKADDLSVILICEGWATGASLREATGLPVICAMNAGNLKPVAIALREKYPKARFIFCADNDAWTTNQAGEPWNPGIEAAQQAAASIGGASVIWPEFEDAETAEKNKWTDFNDAACVMGLEHIKTQVGKVADVAPVSSNDRAVVEAPMSPEPAHHTDNGTPPYYPEHEPDFHYGDFPPISFRVGDFGMRFKCLGYRDGSYFYFSFAEKRVISLTAAQHTFQNLCQLDDMEAWDSSEFGLTAKNKNQLALYAFNGLRKLCLQRGHFSSDSAIKGSGVWSDGEDVVANIGDKLIVNGEKKEYDEYDSDSVYTAGTKFFKDGKEPLSSYEAVGLRRLCEWIRWEDQMSGALLAGWIAVAPISGALGYRPHVWITGASGTGKSVVIDIIRRALGKIAINYEKGTSASRIRHRMGNDARPLIYDEAEPSDVTAGVVELARVASTGGTVGKFGQNDTPVRFCGCFSSVIPPIYSTVDEGRMVFMRLRPHDTDIAARINHYNDLLLLIKDVLTTDFADRLAVRSIKNAAVIIKNAETFMIAAQKTIRRARATQQIGVLLAGLYSLHSHGEITQEAAEKFISENKFEDAVDELEDEADDKRLVRHISSFVLRYSNGPNMTEKPIGEIIALAGNGESVEEKTLRFWGIKVSERRVYFSNTHPNLKKALSGTDWQKRWHDVLSRFSGAERHEATHFSAGVKTRAVSIPLSVFMAQEKMI